MRVWGGRAARKIGPMAGGTEQGGGSGGGWRAWLFPLVLFGFATLFFGGRIGWWTDDYWHNQRDPVSGRVEAWAIHRGFFLRPLFYRIVPAVTTWSWRSQWPAHVLEVASFGAMVAAVWVLLMKLGAGRRAAAAATLLFMVYPGQFETIFWVAALPTSMACVLMLIAMMLTVGMARGRVGWWGAPLMAGLVFALCCLNEQPAAGVAGLPLVYWAAAGRGGRARWRDALRALVPAGLCIGAGAAYAWLVLSDPNKVVGSRGSVQSMVRPGEAWAHLLWFVDVLWRRLVLKNFALGAMATGWAQVRASGLVGAAWGVALAGSALLWLRTWARGPEEETRGSPGRMVWVGLVVFVTGWLPIYIFAAYDPDSRTRTWPCIGAAIALAGVLTAIGSRLRRADAWTKHDVRVAGGVALVALLIPSALMLVGTQAAFKRRYARDQAEGEELKRLIPNPPPLTFFLPLRVDETPVRTGSPVFDSHCRSVWEAAWTTPKFIEALYRRKDVHCGYCRKWTPGVPVRGADETGVNFTDRLGPRFEEIPGSGSRIPWERAVPFIVDAGGRVRIVTRVILPSLHAGGRVEVRVPQAPAGAPDLAVALPRG